MMATIYMQFENDPNEYPYGTYAFNSALEKNRVNDIAEGLKLQRGCDIRIATNKENI